MSIYQKYFDELNTRSAGSAVVTANWLIKIVAAGDDASSGDKKAITTSKIPEFTDFCNLYEHEFFMNRGIESSAAEQIKPDGGLHAKDLKIVVAASFLSADFNTHFHQNNCLNIDIVRIKSLQNPTPQEDERYTFTTCYITDLLVRGDIIAASFRYASFARSVKSHSAEGGNEGATSAQYSFVTASTSGGTE